MSAAADYDVPTHVQFVRAGIARALADTPAEASVWAARRWGGDSRPALIVRSAVEGAGTTGGQWGEQLTGLSREAGAAFLDEVRRQTAFDKIGARMLPPNTPAAATTTRPVATWAGEGKAIRVSKGAFARDTIRPASCGILTVWSRELLESAGTLAEQAIAAALIDALALGVDAAAFDPANDGTAGAPASLTYGAPAAASTGDLDADIDWLLANFAGSLDRSVWVMPPRTAAGIGLAYARGLGANLGPRGGELLGMPALTSEGIEHDSGGGLLILIDGGSVSAADEGVEIERSEHAAIEMDDSPAMDGLAPTGPTGAIVSLFQADLLGLRAIRHVGWKLARPDAVSVITGARYTTGS